MCGDYTGLCGGRPRSVLMVEIRAEKIEERTSGVDAGSGNCVTEVSVSDLFRSITGGGATPATSAAPVLHVKEILSR